MSEPMPLLDTERAMLEEIAECSRVEAAAAARKIALTEQYHQSRYDHPTAAPGAHHDADLAARSALAEIALALATTYSVVSGWLNLAFALQPLDRINDAFTAGDINLTNIRTIIDHTTGAPARTLTRLEAHIIAAATHLGPKALGTEIDRLLIEADPDWTTKIRTRAEKSRRVGTRRLPHGMAGLHSTLTATEATEITTRITALATTVCASDPRETKELRVDAFFALLRGHATLDCRCETQDCATSGNTSTPPAVRLNIMCSLETLLGIADNPAYLAGYGTLDADKARTLAHDATWQAMITAATELAQKLPPEPEEIDEVEEVEPEDETPVTARDELPDGPIRPRIDLWLPKCHDIGLGRDAGIVVARTRTYPAGAVLPRGGAGIARTRISDTHTRLARLHTQIRTDPTTTHAEYPDGHGGFTDPPPGALTYRPSDTLAATVRLRDGTCRHPGCTIPAEDCDIDHVVAFLLAHPHAGGWTILANLQALCPNQHRLKTAKLWHYELLRDAIVHAYNALGQHGLWFPRNRGGSLKPHPGWIR